MNITIDELVDDINKSSQNEYLFIRVLNKEDRVQFLANLKDDYYNEIFTTKKIKLGVWINIMHSIKLSEDYVIYRKAYLGENRGKQYINQQLTNFVVPIWTIKPYTNVNFTINKPVKRILLDGDIMEEFKFKSRKYMLSSWWNSKYEIRNIYIK